MSWEGHSQGRYKTVWYITLVLNWGCVIVVDHCKWTQSWQQGCMISPKTLSKMNRNATYNLLLWNNIAVLNIWTIATPTGVTTNKDGKFIKVNPCSFKSESKIANWSIYVHFMLKAKIYYCIYINTSLHFIGITCFHCFLFGWRQLLSSVSRCSTTSKWLQSRTAKCNLVATIKLLNAHHKTSQEIQTRWSGISEMKGQQDTKRLLGTTGKN